MLRVLMRRANDAKANDANANDANANDTNANDTNKENFFSSCGVQALSQWQCTCRRQNGFAATRSIGATGSFY